MVSENQSLPAFTAASVWCDASQFLYSNSEHKTATKQGQRTLQLLLWPLSKSFCSIVLLLLLLLLGLPWGFQLKVCLRQRGSSSVYVRFTSISAGLFTLPLIFFRVRLHSSSLEITLGQKTRDIFVKRLFTNVCRTLVGLSVAVQVSHP
jgi:hypothetical protein